MGPVLCLADHGPDELSELGQLVDECAQFFHVGGLGRTLPALHRHCRGSGDEGLIEHRRRARRLVPRERNA